jgi:uncharacterized protein
LPCGWSAAVKTIMKLAIIKADLQMERYAEQSFKRIQDSFLKYPQGFGNWLCGLDFYLTTKKLAVIVGDPAQQSTSNLLQVLYENWLPNMVVVAFDPGYPPDNRLTAVFEGKTLVENKPTIYVCEGYTCLSPLNDPIQLRSQLF